MSCVPITLFGTCYVVVTVPYRVFYRLSKFQIGLFECCSACDLNFKLECFN